MILEYESFPIKASGASDSDLVFWGTTLYHSSFEWPNNFHHFDIFISNRDYRDTNKYHDVLWSIVSDDPIKFNHKTEKYGIPFPWNTD